MIKEFSQDWRLSPKTVKLMKIIADKSIEKICSSQQWKTSGLNYQNDYAGVGRVDMGKGLTFDTPLFKQLNDAKYASDTVTEAASEVLQFDMQAPAVFLDQLEYSHEDDMRFACNLANAMSIKSENRCEIRFFGYAFPNIIASSNDDTVLFSSCEFEGCNGEMKKGSYFSILKSVATTRRTLFHEIGHQIQDTAMISPKARKALMTEKGAIEYEQTKKSLPGTIGYYLTDKLDCMVPDRICSYQAGNEPVRQEKEWHDIGRPYLILISSMQESKRDIVSKNLDYLNGNNSQQAYMEDCRERFANCFSALCMNALYVKALAACSKPV